MDERIASERTWERYLRPSWRDYFDYRPRERDFKPSHPLLQGLDPEPEPDAETTA